MIFSLLKLVMIAIIGVFDTQDLDSNNIVFLQNQHFNIVGKLLR